MLLNEFDYVEGGAAVDLFRTNYLLLSQNGAQPIDYPYSFIAPSNTGIPSGFDLDNDGTVGGANDAFGFGDFPGQYGMVVLSRYPIVEDQVRTFQNLLWASVPGARLPDDPATAEPADWYSADELAVLRLSSKSHWDVPIDVDGRIVHVLAAHPTPPMFDGPEDRNGMRNADEIGFWADYVAGVDSSWIIDDAGVSGGLTADAEFVILGDLNSDPLDGDSLAGRRSTRCSPSTASRTRNRPATGRSRPRSPSGGSTTRNAATRRSTPLTSPTTPPATCASTTSCRRTASRSSTPACSGLPPATIWRAWSRRAAGQLRPPTGVGRPRLTVDEPRPLDPESRRQPNDLGVDGLDIETLDTQVQDRNPGDPEADSIVGRAAGRVHLDEVVTRGRQLQRRLRLIDGEAEPSGENTENTALSAAASICTAIVWPAPRRTKASVVPEPTESRTEAVLVPAANSMRRIDAGIVTFIEYVGEESPRPPPMTIVWSPAGGAGRSRLPGRLAAGPVRGEHPEAGAGAGRADLDRHPLSSGGAQDVAIALTLAERALHRRVVRSRGELDALHGRAGGRDARSS